MKMDNKIRSMAFFGAIAVVVVLVVLAFTNFSNAQAQTVKSASLTQNVAQGAAANGGSVQDVKLTMEGYTYILTPGTLKKGVPVRMEADLGTVTGCMRDVVISAFGVRKYVSEGDNIIEFTPTRAGTFNIACSMNMGRGQFTVLESDGTKSTNVEAAAPAATGGGCGCGGGAKKATATGGTAATASLAGGACHG
jgi:uncharacterized protein